MSPPLRIAVYGTGRVAGSLAGALSGPLATTGEATLVGVSGRDTGRAAAARVGVPFLEPEALGAAADLLVVAVSDAAILEVAHQLAAVPADPAAAARTAPRWVAHCAGALGPEALGPLAANGWRTAVWHPLQAFPTSHTPPAPGITWTITTDDPELARALERLTTALGGRPHRLAAEDRPAYHAAAVLAANYPAALVAHAAEVLRGCGFAEDEALAALLPLTRSALDALATAGVPAGLTGPVVRGDVATVTAHLAALDARPDTRDLYRAAGQAMLPFAQARGLSARDAERIRAALTSPPGLS